MLVDDATPSEQAKVHNNRMSVDDEHRLIHAIDFCTLNVCLPPFMHFENVDSQHEAAKLYKKLCVIEDNAMHCNAMQWHSPALEKTLCHAPFLVYGDLGRSPCHPASSSEHTVMASI